MKIGINSRLYQQATSGIPYYIENLYLKLQEIDIINKYLFFQTAKNKTLGKTVVSSSKNTGLNGALFDLFKISKLVKRTKVNILHGTSFILPFFPLKGVKYVVTIHDLAFLRLKDEPNDYSIWYYLFSKYGIGRSLKVADVIVSDSNSTKKDIVEYYRINSDKIKVVHLGINEAIVLSRGKEKRIIKERYFFSVSTNPKRKNTLSVLQAMATSKKLSKLKYVIAGQIPENQKAELRDEIDRLKLNKRVIVFGFAEEKELGNLYRNADFFIYPSFYEGFGFPVVEAMACKCPVITSNNSSLIELMPTKDWLVDPYKVKDIRNKMEKIASLNKIERLGLIEKNFEFSRKFSWKKTALKMKNIFEDLNSQ